MPENEIVAAVDVGTTKICTVVGDVDSSGVVRILGMGQAPSEGLRKGVVVDIESASRNIRASVDEAARITGVQINQVVVGVTGEHISSVTGRGATTITHANREITEQDVHRVMEMARPAQIAADREIIHVLPRGFAVDGQGGVRQPVGMSGTRLDVETHVITGASAFLQNVLKSVQQAGLQVDTIVLEPVATSEAVLTEEEKEVGVVVADIGGGTTDVAVVVDGAIAHSSVIPVGGNHVTSDLAVGLKTSRAEAERLKKEYGCALVSMATDNELVEMSTLEGENKRPILRRALADIIEPRMQEIFTIIRDDLKQHGFQHSLSGIVLSGGGSLLHGAPELAQETLLLPARIGRPRDVNGKGESLDSPIYATAVGLLYFGAARRYREKHYAHTQGFLANAWGQLRHWLLRIFGG